MQLKRTFCNANLKRFKLLTTVLRLPLWRVDVCRHLHRMAHLWCRNFVILYKVLLKLLLLWCTVCCHFTLLSTVAGPRSSSSPSLHSWYSFHCAGFLHDRSLVQWHGHPSKQCVQYLIPNYKSWWASTRFHVASASPAVAAACGVSVQLTVASCFLILQEPLTLETTESY